MEIADLAGALIDHPALAGAELLVLHGSRARGEAGPASDWDVACLGAVDLVSVATAVSDLVGTDAVDVVDLGRASALLRFRAARDGVALVERRPGAFLDFRLAAVEFWCDAGSVIRAAQAEVLASLG